MCRKEIRVMDCTVREGDLMNKWQFSVDFLKALYKGCVDAGTDYIAAVAGCYSKSCKTLAG